MLGVRNIAVADSIFREAALPHSKWNFPKLSPACWMVWFRILWLMGYSNHCETLQEAKKRANIGGKKLESLAREKGPVLLIGHGFMNRLIANYLRRNGWEGPKSPGHNYWEFTVYRFRREKLTEGLTDLGIL
jgi:broad specificity phosphatase PhoE